MEEGSAPKTPFCFYDARSKHWSELADGLVLGRARGDEKFAVDLQKSTNYCRIEISGGVVTLTDLGSPTGTDVNGRIILAGQSIGLQVGDRLRINDRALVLTLGRTVPASRVEKPAEPTNQQSTGDGVNALPLEPQAEETTDEITPPAAAAPRAASKGPISMEVRGAPSSFWSLLLDWLLSLWELLKSARDFFARVFRERLLKMPRPGIEALIVALVVGMIAWKLLSPIKRPDKGDASSAASPPSDIALTGVPSSVPSAIPSWRPSPAPTATPSWKPSPKPFAPPSWTPSPTPFRSWTPRADHANSDRLSDSSRNAGAGAGNAAGVGGGAASAGAASARSAGASGHPSDSPFILLYATGVADSGAPIPRGGIDPHYRMTSNDASFPGPNAIVPTQIGSWAVSPSNSQWVSVQPNRNGGTDLIYIYKTEFTLSNRDPKAVSLTGTWACDDSCVLQLNGVAIASNETPAWSMIRRFLVPVGSPFVNGVNELTFIVRNTTGGPTGLLVSHIAVTGGQ